MPNHVYNTMTVEGTPEAIKAFREKARHEDKEFSYWNFITPPQEAIDSGEYEGTRGYENGQPIGRTPNNRYEFNIREWGTKWDAYEVDTNFVYDDPETTFFVQWASAWGEPRPVFEAMTKQHPELSFEFSWEEEQGWGGEAKGRTGHFTVEEEWDIPDSHAEYAKRGRVSQCLCNEYYEIDPWDFYKDCPDYKPKPEPKLTKKQREAILAMAEAVKVIEISMDRESGKLVIK